MTSDLGEPGAADRCVELRARFARTVAARAGARDPRIEQAFAAVPREPFAGPAPWFILPVGPEAARTVEPGYVQSPDDDPAFLYQDSLVALDRAKGINIGAPSLHARCLDALAVRSGEIVVQVGAGSGYYTAILAHLVGPAGRVHAFEIEPALAARTARNLADWPWVDVQTRSGIARDLPAADIVYVSAGITQPSWAWLEALRPDGRLLFPLQPTEGCGGMLLVRKRAAGGLAWSARFVSRAAFVACHGRQDDDTGRGLAASFAAGGWDAVSSIHLDDKPDDTCWFDGGDWWLSTRPA